MVTLVSPSVRLIARPRLDGISMYEYITEVGGEEWWERVFGQTYAGPRPSFQKHCPAEVLVEFAGRLCYRSWTEGLNANVTQVRKDSAEYFRNILSTGHGCYDDATEVLTAAGWKTWDDVTEDDRFATRAIDGSLEYHRPLRLIRKHHDGPMVRVEARGVDLLVTPDHKMLACRTTTKRGRQKLDFELLAAATLVDVSHAYVKTAEWNGGVEIGLTADSAAVLGFLIGDGSTARGDRLSFHLRRERKIAWLEATCDRLGWKFSAGASDHFVVLVPEHLWPLFADVYTDDRQKQIPHGVLFAQRGVLVGLYSGLMESDGHRGRTGDSFDTTSDVLADQVQHLALHLGIAANVCYRRENRASSYGDRPLTRLSLIRRELKPEVNKFAGGVGTASIVDQWSGEVFCAEVPNNTLYVRRNGIPVWSGNSVLEHAQFSFVLHNVSRVFTHEQVRHRAGAAFSQESMRFVRLTELPFWFPDWAQADEELMRRSLELLERMEQHQVWMAEWFGLDDDGVPFGEKKAKTSFMRRFAPDGVATGMVLSANIRAIRHMIEMRTDGAAEEEIRLVYSKIGEIMVKEAPLLFGDYERQEDGSWQTPYRKV